MRLVLTVLVACSALVTGSRAEATDISGIWKGSIRCSYGSGSLSITVSRDGSISGGVTNGKVISGRVSGKSVQFSTANAFGNVANFTGTVVGDDMSGTYSQSVNGTVCNWDASLRTGVRTSQSANPGKDPEPDYSKLDAKKKRAARERDAQSFLTAGAAAAQYCTYADQMTAAGRFSQASEAFRLMGDSVRQSKADKLAKAASARADECQRRQKAARQAPPKPKASKKADETAAAKANEIAKACNALKQYSKKLEDSGNLEAALKVRVKMRIHKCK